MGAFFSGDTVICLSEWINQDDIDSKCSSVMKWAIPKKDDTRTDELGMSEKDYAEKREWQAKRKNARVAAIERMRETDAQREKERQKMEKLKKENPEEYELLLKEEEERKKNLEEQKKRERRLTAARERRSRAEAGLPDEPEEVVPQTRRRPRPAAQKTNWLPYVLGLLFCAFIFFNVLNWMNKDKGD